MCGIAGFSGALARRDDAAQRLAAMTHALAHRGPDGDGAFVDAEAGIALGHRRLAIIDLSGGGRQPMASPGGRFIVTFNGEIYNYLELRAELLAAGVVLKSQSDTEVFLAFAERFGLDSFLKRAEGMFAFALWDREARALILARDHAGIKPLFWTRSGNGIAFASELKAFRALPDWVPEIDRGSLALYLRFGYVPAPRSIYRGVHKISVDFYFTTLTQCLKQNYKYYC